MKPDAIQAVIDAGSSQIRVIVAQKEENQPLEIIGCGVVNTVSIKNGLVSDIAATAKAVRQAIDEAEQQSGFEIRNVDAAIGGEQVSGMNSVADCAIPTGKIRSDEINRIVLQARQKISDENHQILHILEQQYQVDEHSGIDEPIGMVADKLTAHLHILRVIKNNAENLKRAIEAAGIGINALVFSGLASSYAATTKEEREMGVCVLDIGAGTSNFMAWYEHRPLYSGGLNIGGEWVSSDLATTFTTPRQFAEMIKCQQGAIRLSMMKSEWVDLPSTGLRPSRQVASADVVKVITARYEEIFAQLEKALHRQGMRRMSEGGLVLTGGAAQIPGLAAYVTEEFSIPVRIARPEQIVNLPDHLQYDPSMMTSLGMLKLLYEPIADHVWAKPPKKGIIARLSSMFSRS